MTHEVHYCHVVLFCNQQVTAIDIGYNFCCIEIKNNKFWWIEYRVVERIIMQLNRSKRHIAVFEQNCRIARFLWNHKAVQRA